MTIRYPFSFLLEMLHTLRAIILSIAAISLITNTVEAKGGVQYLDLDPYEALAHAQSSGRMLMVEFYAPWNSRSRWMNEKTLGNEQVGRFVDEHFVCVKIDTQSPKGALLAQDYQVTTYPTIVVFDDRGNVLDKIEVTLDAEDFESRLLSVIMAADGNGGWQLRMSFASVESGDIPQAEKSAAEYIDSHQRGEIINSVVWPIFSNNSVTRYGSYTFNYMIDNIEAMRTELGREQVDPQIEEKLLNAMLPYTLGTVPYDSATISDIINISRRTGPEVLTPNLEAMARLAELRRSGEILPLINQTSYLIDHLPEDMALPLTLGLDIVCDRGTKSERNAAARIVTQTITLSRSGSSFTLLDDLRTRLK